MTSGRRRDLADLVARATVAGLFLSLAVRIGADVLATGRVTGLLLLTSELLVVILTVFRRAALAIDHCWDARLVTALSILGPALLRPGEAPPGLPEVVTATLSGCGLLIVVVGKLALGRSFGLMPAHRGLVSSGPYRFVRHPIYLGYLITHAGFLASHPTWWNVAMLAGADLALIVRAGYEERTLLADPAYGAYSGRVKWRMVPGVY